MKKTSERNSNLGNGEIVSLSQDGWSLREISSLSKAKELYLSVCRSSAGALIEDTVNSY